MTSLILPELIPSRSTRMLARHHVHQIKYGQGHSVRLRDGAQPFETRWTVVWDGLTLTEANSLNTVFTAGKGVDSFAWKAPGEITSHRYVCLEWQMIPTAFEHRKVEALFLRVPQ